MRLILLAACTLLLSTPAIAADQFDLVCRAKDKTERYRVNLATGEFCTDECEVMGRLHESSETVIVFQHDRPGRFARQEVYIGVDRRTGVWRWSFKAGFFTEEHTGTCEAAPFSGFGPTKF